MKQTSPQSNRRRKTVEPDTTAPKSKTSTSGAGARQKSRVKSKRKVTATVKTGKTQPEVVTDLEVSSSDRSSQQMPTADDSELLHRARMQWQFGDWETLAMLDPHVVEKHSERAMLALLVGSAHQQLDDHENARLFVMRAREWGCDKRTIARILISGVYNTLGRVAAVGQEEVRALAHFKAAVDGVSGDTRLACQARSVSEIARLNLVDQAVRMIKLQERPGLGGSSNHDAGRLEPPSHTAALASERPNRLSNGPDQAAQQRMQWLAEKCMAKDDLHAAVDSELSSPTISRQDAFLFCIALSDELKKESDNLTALHYLNMAREHMIEGDPNAIGLLSKKMLALGHREEALDILVAQTVSDADLDAGAKAALNDSYTKVRTATKEKSEHGHTLLLAYLRAHSDTFKKRTGNRTPVLIEVGSTRENVPGQGSTRIIADYCKTEGMDFITVDMDPHNTDAAAAMFRKMGVGFQAVNKKGEDYLREYEGDMDLVFLDAYDFDHGKHSALRQSRYEKYLGSPIDEAECHQMHLDCAQSVHKKLSESGLVCVDDTWLVDGKWCAKGTLAVPYLLANGFEIVEARNRAALLRRKSLAA